MTTKTRIRNATTELYQLRTRVAVLEAELKKAHSKPMVVIDSSNGEDYGCVIYFHREGSDIHIDSQCYLPIKNKENKE